MSKDSAKILNIDSLRRRENGHYSSYDAPEYQDDVIYLLWRMDNTPDFTIKLWRLVSWFQHDGRKHFAYIGGALVFRQGLEAVYKLRKEAFDAVTKEIEQAGKNYRDGSRRPLKEEFANRPRDIKSGVVIKYLVWRIKEPAQVKERFIHELQWTLRRRGYTESELFYSALGGVSAERKEIQAVVKRLGEPAVYQPTPNYEAYMSRNDQRCCAGGDRGQVIQLFHGK